VFEQKRVVFDGERVVFDRNIIVFDGERVMFERNRVVFAEVEVRQHVFGGRFHDFESVNGFASGIASALSCFTEFAPSGAGCK
jgi:hypothetical protein